MASAADGLQTALASAKTLADTVRVLREADEFLASAREELAAMLRQEGMTWEEITAVVETTKAAG